jgi:hypothetical protein
MKQFIFIYSVVQDAESPDAEVGTKYKDQWE